MLKKNTLLTSGSFNVMPDVSKNLSWLENNPDILKGVCRGLERETLRINSDGYLANTVHPEFFGSSLKHKWITTDFAEALMEFITPVDDDINHMLTFLRDIHRYVSRLLVNEKLWPFSMPCIIDNPDNIQLAQYGTSNIGKMKALYRQGLKHRYGAMMQMISGVHYNFSLPLTFWREWRQLNNLKINNDKESTSIGYLHLIRNYYRFGWITPYLFGASPAICTSFARRKRNNIQFETNNKGTSWLPYATSLRLSDFGYNNSQNNLGITFNSLKGYVNSIKAATRTPSKKYSKISTKDKYGNWLQINTNILQIENELYSPIRPKRTIDNKNLSNILLSDGIEYIEIRSLDINPFSAIGIEADQIRFLDLLLTWCVLAESKKMSSNEFSYISQNWKRIVLYGRQPGQIIDFFNDKIQYKLVDVGKALFSDLYRIATVFDRHYNSKLYQQVCDKLVVLFEHSELTYSARILDKIKENGYQELGVLLAQEYWNTLQKESLEVLSEETLNMQARESIILQKELEISDNIDFESYLLNILK